MAGVEKFAANCGATVYMVLLSVLQLLLAAHAQQDDIVVSHSCLLQTCHNHFCGYQYSLTPESPANLSIPGAMLPCAWCCQNSCSCCIGIIACRRTGRH